ncbi:MAG: DUF2442 domain-containing protein [Vicinamibacterales bacterium]
MTDAHPIHRVRGFAIVAPYVLRVDFQDGSTRTIDFAPMLEGELYSPLRDLRLFNQVRVDPEVHTLTWPNGADFDPTTLHDWPEVGDHMAEMARRWAEASDSSRFAE